MLCGLLHPHVILQIIPPPPNNNNNNSNSDIKNNNNDKKNTENVLWYQYPYQQMYKFRYWIRNRTRAKKKKKKKWISASLHTPWMCLLFHSSSVYSHLQQPCSAYLTVSLSLCVAHSGIFLIWIHCNAEHCCTISSYARKSEHYYLISMNQSTHKLWLRMPICCCNVIGVVY